MTADQHDEPARVRDPKKAAPADLRIPTDDVMSKGLSVLRESIKLVPANKYAFGVVGIVAAAAISATLVGGRWELAIIGGVATLAGMVVLRVFAEDNKRKDGQRPNAPLHAQALTWFCVLAFTAVLSIFIAKLYEILFPRNQFIQPQATPLSPSTQSIKPIANAAGLPGLNPVHPAVVGSSSNKRPKQPTRVPTTSAPTTVPTTSAPTTVPATSAPTAVPTTSAPTTVPATSAPVAVPPTTRAANAINRIKGNQVDDDTLREWYDKCLGRTSHGLTGHKVAQELLKYFSGNDCVSLP